MAKKRVFSLILALIFVLTMCTGLWGCAKKEKNAFNNSNTVNTSPGEIIQTEDVSQTPTNYEESNSNTSDNIPAEKPSEGKTMEELINDMHKDKQKVNAYLIMGIDKHGESSTYEGKLDGGQCDAIYLLLLNEKEKKYSILQLNRDTITDIPVPERNTDIIHYFQYPLALAHGYGSGGKDSCENAVWAVSNMLGGVRIDGYIAMNFEGIIEINDAVGGVDVLVEDDMTPADPLLVKGETVHLEGQHVLSFVRTREGVTDDLNLNRMRRQRTYLKALMAKYKTEIKQNSAILNDAYIRTEPFILSNLSMSEITNIAAKCASFNGGNIEATKGSGEWTYHEKSGKTFFYFYLDESALKEQVQRLFY